MLEGLFDADRWSTTFQNMGPFWEGFGVTLQVVVAGLLLSLVLGTLLAVARISVFAPLRWFATLYVNCFRSIPLVMVLLWFYLIVPQVRRIRIAYNS